MDDWELLRRYVAGDRAAMERLVARHIDLVYAIACRASSGSAAEADDITQAVFLLLTQKAARIVHRGTLVGWLYRATRWCAANYRRQERRRKQLIQEAAMDARSSEERPPSAPADILELLTPALRRLKEPERAAVLLRYMSQKSFAEVAEALGITPEAARKRAERGLDKLRAYFLAHGHAGVSALLLTDAFSSAAMKAPAAAVASTLHIAGGGAVSPRVAGLLRHSVSLPAKMAACVLIAGALLAAGISWFHRPPAMAAASVPAALSDLPPLQLVAVDPAHPTEAEVKTFLKARLERLSNLAVRYDVHTEYVAPPNGWPTAPERPADASPPEGLIIAPAPIIALAPMFEPNMSLLTLFPSGTVDAAKTFDRLPGHLRYDRQITHLAPAVAFPEGLHPFTQQTYLFHDGVVDRLLTDPDGPTTTASSPEVALPEPDIETALLLTGYMYPPMGLSPAAVHPVARVLTPADIDTMHITCPDARHIIVSREFPSRRASSTRPARHEEAAREEWTLDRDAGCAPCAYRSASALCPVEMTMTDFHDVAGVSVPRKVEIRFSIQAPTTPVLWRRDTLTITDCRIQDAANTPASYTIDWPEGIVPATATRSPAATQRFAPPLKTMELFIGAESFPIDSLTRLNRPYLDAARGASPSKPAYHDTPAFNAAHAAFRKRARQGDVDVLFLGGALIQHWVDDPATWNKVAASDRTANFGLSGNLIEHILWRVTHGELDGLSPKLIVLLAGEADALATTASRSRAAQTNISTANYGAIIQWYPLGYSTDAVAAGIVHLIRTVHEKCPRARIVVLGIPPRATRPGASPAAQDSISQINEHIAQINQSVSGVEDHAAIHFIDLGPTVFTPGGDVDRTLLQINGLPTPALYARWNDLLAPYLHAARKP